MKALFPILICAALAACGSEPAADGRAPGEDAAHEEQAVHGGTLVELTGHAGHVEALHDAQAGTLTIWVTDTAMAELPLDEAPVLNFVADGKPTQLTGDEVDGAWRFTGDGLEGEPEGARLRLTSGGKTWTPALAHEHE